MFVHDIDEGKALRNFRGKLAPEGRLFVSFRNPLFALITLNEHTMPFYEGLLDHAGVSGKDRKAALAYFAKSCRNRYVSRDSSRAFGKDFAKTFSKFHNPLEIPALFERAGFEVEDLRYFNMHPLPPRILERVGPRYAVTARMERTMSRSWQAMFMASSFLVCARKR